jgi:glycerate 2-kinase
MAGNARSQREYCIVKIVIAPDKFKGCLSAADVARAIAAGVKRASPDASIDQCPMADGGEGTVDALVAATGGRIVTRRVTGPLAGMKVDAPIGILGDGETAVIEMAAASGLHLLAPEKRDPMRTTTYGTGELLRIAVEELDAKRVILGIGGSATVDGGIGAAQAWGAQFTLATGAAYGRDDRRLTGGDLLNLLRVHTSFSDTRPSGPPLNAPGNTTLARRHQALLDTRGAAFVVACDVGNPLLGPNGAAPIFAPQKGATPDQVEQLDRGLRRLVDRLSLHTLADHPGAGAAGGLGFGMMAFFGATLQSGAHIVIDAVKLRTRLVGADLCITGEGQLDMQSLAGKTPISVAQICREMKIPCIALAGSIAPSLSAAHTEGLTAFFSICDRPMTLEEAMQNTPPLLQQAAEQLTRTLLARRPEDVV